MNRLSLKTFDDMRSAYSFANKLEYEYLRTNKKKMTIDLTLSSTSKPFFDQRGRVKIGPEKIEVNAIYDDADALQKKEIDWFKQKVLEL